jgi:hypothetical protein
VTVCHTIAIYFPPATSKYSPRIARVAGWPRHCRRCAARPRDPRKLLAIGAKVDTAHREALGRHLARLDRRGPNRISVRHLLERHALVAEQKIHWQGLDAANLPRCSTARRPVSSTGWPTTWRTPVSASAPRAPRSYLLGYANADQHGILGNMACERAVIPASHRGGEARLPVSHLGDEFVTRQGNRAGGAARCRESRSGEEEGPAIVHAFKTVRHERRAGCEDWRFRFDGDAPRRPLQPLVRPVVLLLNP